MGDKMRLDKYLSDMAVGTRSQIKDMARQGRIQVNGEIVKKTDRKVSLEEDQVVCDGVPIAYVVKEYYMLNKPQGVVSATEDHVHRTVMDLIKTSSPKRKDLFPVGRLDMDTEGLLLITNDGELAHSLLSPKRHVDKTYYAELEGELPEDAARRLEEGITLLDGTPTMGARLELLGESVRGTEEPGDQGNFGADSCAGAVKEAPLAVTLTIQEGKFHQVKRMFEALGCRVVYLKRLSMGSLRLDESLKPGEYRPLTLEEVKALAAVHSMTRKGKG